MEHLEVGILTTIIGMGVVFSVLVVLSIVTAVIAKLTSPAPKPKKEAAPAPVEVETQPVAAAPAPAAASASGLNPQTVAVIMAAVSMASGLPVNRLKFTAIRRNNTLRTPWSEAATVDRIQTQQSS